MKEIKEINVESNGNFCRTETNVNPGSPVNGYFGSVTRWDCGCVTASGGYRRLCTLHQDIPLVRRKLREPVRADSTNRATTASYGDEVFLVCDTEHIKKIRRRVEDALRKGGTGQVLRCAEILGVRID